MIEKAVILPFDEYSHLKDLEEFFEYFEINDSIAERIKKYRPESNVDWDKIKPKSCLE